MQNIKEMTKKNNEAFLKKLESDMHYQAEQADATSFEWVEKLEYACPYIDNAVRKPKLTLIKEENIEKIEKTKKVTVETVKDLSKHTNFIDSIDEKTGDVLPFKLLDIRSIDTFNTYENRFIFTLLDKIGRYVRKKVEELENIDLKSKRFIEYKAKTKTLGGNVDIELLINSNEEPKGNNADDLLSEIQKMKPRIKKIQDYISMWEKSDFTKTLIKERAAFVKPPITKTNVIIKNPNFQEAMKIWVFLAKEDEKDEKDAKEGDENHGDKILKSMLDHSFLIDYLVLNSVSQIKNEQRENVKETVKAIIELEIKRMVELSVAMGVHISNEELLSMFNVAMQDEKSKILQGNKEVKNKFKNALDEYLEKTKEIL